MKPVELVGAMRATFAKCAPKLSMVSNVLDLQKGAGVKNEDVDLLKAMFDVRQYSCSFAVQKVSEMEFQGTAQLRYIYGGSRFCIMAHWKDIALCLKELGKPVNGIIQLQKEFLHFGEAEVTKMKAMGLPIYTAQHGTSTLMYTPMGYMICESVLDGQPVVGLRLTACVATRCPAAYPEFRDTLHEADPKSPAIPQMNALIRYMSTLPES